MRSEVDFREAVHAWVREDLPVGAKMVLGFHVNSLIARLGRLQSASPAPLKCRTVGDAMDQMETAWARVRTGMDRREVFEAGWIAGFDFGSLHSASPSAPGTPSELSLPTGCGDLGSLRPSGSVLGSTNMCEPGAVAPSSDGERG